VRGLILAINSGSLYCKVIPLLCSGVAIALLKVKVAGAPDVTKLNEIDLVSSVATLIGTPAANNIVDLAVGYREVN
jgi:hypothetical protein